ncbi:peroxidase [Sesbania bispinosa]|nr:peroxidase [Sesbania bispinosa]
MEEQQRGQRIIPRRLSFNLDDFMGMPDGEEEGIRVFQKPPVKSALSSTS